MPYGSVLCVAAVGGVCGVRGGHVARPGVSGPAGQGPRPLLGRSPADRRRLRPPLHHLLLPGHQCRPRPALSRVSTEYSVLLWFSNDTGEYRVLSSALLVQHYNEWVPST